MAEPLGPAKIYGIACRLETREAESEPCDLKGFIGSRMLTPTTDTNGRGVARTDVGRRVPCRSRLR